MGSRSSEVALLLRETRWSGDDSTGSYLGDILKTQIFPLVAKVSQGSYAGLTAGSHVLLLSAGHTHSLVGQCVKFKKKTGRPTSRASPFGPTLLIPSTFPGHFELLNEEGRSVPCLLSVEALARSGTKSCLVRDPFKAWLAEGDEKTYRIGNKSRTLLPGEVITLVGVVSVPSKSKGVGKYVRCLDEDKQTVFLPCSAKGKFSPVTECEGDGIGGVHTTRGVLGKRLPLMVRLCSGRPPCNGRNFKFFPELRLYSSLKEQLLFAMPLTPSWKESLIPLPTSAPLKFQVAKNMDELEGGVAQFSSLVHKGGCLLHQVKDRIQIYDISLQNELSRFDGRQWKAYAPPIFFASNNGPIPTTESKERPSSGEPEDEEEYQDIDELYDYVRGLKPSPSNMPKPSTTTLVTITSSGHSGPDVIAHVANSDHCNAKVKDPHPAEADKKVLILKSSDILLEENKRKERLCPPQPPPIETIPSRLNKAPPPQDLSINLLNSRNNRETHHHHHHIHHHHGTQIQIQIRSGNDHNDYNHKDHHRHPLTQGILITTSGASDNKKMLQLDSAGGSVSTTPTNTSGSAQSSSSSSNSKSKLRTGLFIKHNKAVVDHNPSGGQHYHHHHHTHGNVAGGLSSKTQLGAPMMFRRSPMFDTRYKSLTDLSNPLVNGASGGIYYGGRGSLTNLNSSSNQHVTIESMRGQQSNINIRPKSLSNILALDDMIHIKQPLGGMGVRKRLAELIVLPNQIHGEKSKSSSQRSARHFRKASLQHSSLFL